MKRIGIVTITAYNFGNRLQNYAIQKVLEDMGLSPESLGILGSPELLGPYRFPKVPTKNPWYFVRKVGGYILTKLFYQEREKNYQRFDDHIIWSKHTLQEDSPGDYDYYVVGSDQVWNAPWFEGSPWAENAFLLAFAPPEKRICFSPSFGISELPERWKPLFKEELSKFRKISVREDAGAAIVKELTGKDAEVLIDPTCMLDADDWIKLAKMPEGFDPEKPYILTYILGGSFDQVKRDLRSYADTYHLRVCNLLDLLDKDLYVAGPSEFIWLIAHAELILTNSFHGTVFSFLFQKPFVVYGNLRSLFSRIETLLTKFDILRKFADSGLPNELFECDYQKGYEQLKKEREKAKRFLLESLEQ